MKIPFNYLPQEFKNINSIISKWKLLSKSTEFTLGPVVKKFENRFAKYIGSKYCISTNNGTESLILCLKALGVKYGDEVITVSNTFYATAGAIVACSATPIFVDCDSRYQINIEQIEKKITKKTKVIIPVHWGGASPDDMQRNAGASTFTAPARHGQTTADTSESAENRSPHVPSTRNPHGEASLADWRGGRVVAKRERPASPVHPIAKTPGYAGRRCKSGNVVRIRRTHAAE